MLHSALRIIVQFHPTPSFTTNPTPSQKRKRGLRPARPSSRPAQQAACAAPPPPQLIRIHASPVRRKRLDAAAGATEPLPTDDRRATEDALLDPCEWAAACEDGCGSEAGSKGGSGGSDGIRQQR